MTEATPREVLIETLARVIGGARVAVVGAQSPIPAAAALFAFQRDQARFRLDSVHPGHSLEDVIENTGFEFDRADPLATTPAPDADSLAVIRGPVQERLAVIYPEFARALAAN